MVPEDVSSFGFKDANFVVKDAEIPTLGTFIREL